MPTDAPINAVLDPLIGPGHKGFPVGVAALRRSQIGAQGWNVLAGDLPLPLAVIKRSALQHNLGWMQRFTAERGIALAPHGKTTMSPQLFQAQLAHDAWGITFATVGQWAVGVAAGVRRSLIANQVFNATDLDGLAALLSAHGADGQADAEPRVLFLLDSAEQLRLIEAWREQRLARAAAAPAFDVLLELGVAGGRTGCRDDAQALVLARAAQASAAVRLCGIECYEGLGISGDEASDRAYAQALLARVQRLAGQCDAQGLFEGPEAIISAGGSAVFDLVAPALKPQLSRPVLGLLRSGCYITHDQGNYKRLVGLVNRRLGCANGLQSALEVWTSVQSLPEPGLALLTAGRRDVSFDAGMPVPLLWCPRGSRTPQLVPAAWVISGMNDQHAYLRLGDGAGDGVGASAGAGEAVGTGAASGAPALAVGDRIALGISHPCTTFDKWRWMAVVDDDHNVVDAVVTWF